MMVSTRLCKTSFKLVNSTVPPFLLSRDDKAYSPITNFISFIPMREPSRLDSVLTMKHTSTASEWTVVDSLLA